MKISNKNNNLPFLKIDIVEILESLAKRTTEPLKKFSYWALTQSLKNKWISPFLMDYLILVERERHARKKAECLNKITEEQEKSEAKSDKNNYIQTASTEHLMLERPQAKDIKMVKRNTHKDELER